MPAKNAKKQAAPAPAVIASPLAGRSMYLWKLAPVLEVEGGIDAFVAKAVRAKLSGVWIKIADGRNVYNGLGGANRGVMHDCVSALHDANIAVWGWQVPVSATEAHARTEAELSSSLADTFALDGVMMDAEKPEGAYFFHGGEREAEIYASTLKEKLTALGKPLAISSHDIPSNFAGFPFDTFARYADVNAPQVYYGGSSSVSHRLNRAIDANAHLDIPFIPVGSGWLGDGGGCSSASACAERAVTFMNLVREHGFPGYSFWHWHGAPSELWRVLYANNV